PVFASASRRAFCESVRHSCLVCVARRAESFLVIAHRLFTARSAVYLRGTGLADQSRADRIFTSFTSSTNQVPRPRRAPPLRDRIAQKLLESSLISQDQLARALESQQSQGGTLSYNLVKTGAISEMAFAEF